MIAVSLRTWMVEGTLGPIHLGATRAQLRRTVGPPDLSGCQDQVWKYGDIEVLFYGSEPEDGVYCVNLHAFSGVPTGGERVALDPWILQSALPLPTLRQALTDAGIGHREAAEPSDAAAWRIITCEEPRVWLDIILGAGGGGLGLVGLYGIWMRE